MLYTLIILAVTALLFALNRVRSDVVALCALIALPLQLIMGIVMIIVLPLLFPF